jgi:NarL family two-component system response regulator LiaR
MPDKNCIRILVADDHAVVRTGLSAFLSTCSDFVLVGEAKSGEAAVRMCDRLKPDIILMDLVMPGMDGIEATRQIRRKQPDIRVIALTSFKERDQVKAAIQAGAMSYLLKDVSAEELARAIRQAYAGKPTLAPEAAEVLIQVARQEDRIPGDDLTEREREVLALMAEGLNNQQIADRLVIGVSTAKSHVGNILSKLGVSSRSEAISLAYQWKLVQAKNFSPRN